MTLYNANNNNHTLIQTQDVISLVPSLAMVTVGDTRQHTP